MKHLIAFLITLPVSAAVVLTFPNPAVYTSPYSIQISGSAIISPTGGGYIKGVVSGTTSIAFNVDTSLNAGQSSANMPSFRVTIDDAPSAYVQEGTSDTQTVLASGLTTGSHHYLIQFLGGQTTGGNSWSGTWQQTKVNSIQFDSGATPAAPSIRPNTCLVFGDSYLMAVVAASQVGSWYNYIDFTMSWPRWVASALNCEYGQVGIGTSGWLNSGNGSYPAFPSYWDHYDSTHSRDLSKVPDYLIIAEGNNEHVGTWSTGQINTAVTNWLTAMRAVWPIANTYILTPFSDIADAANHAQIATSTQAFAVANSDTHLWSIDIGTEYQGCLPFSGGATWCSFDGLHPSIPYHGAIGAMITRQILGVTGTSIVIGGVKIR